MLNAAYLLGAGHIMEWNNLHYTDVHDGCSIIQMSFYFTNINVSPTYFCFLFKHKLK